MKTICGDFVFNNDMSTILPIKTVIKIPILHYIKHLMIFVAYNFVHQL